MAFVSKLLQAVLEATLPILATALAAWLVTKTREVLRKLRDKNPELGEILTNISKAAVNAAEQSIVGTGLGKQKKEYAINVVTKYLKEKGLDIDLDIIDAMIESQVRQMNSFEIFVPDFQEIGDGDNVSAAVSE